MAGITHPSHGKIPDVMYWSLRDYGARVGVFRVMDVLSQRGIRASVMLNSEVCDVYPHRSYKAGRR